MSDSAAQQLEPLWTVEVRERISQGLQDRLNLPVEGTESLQTNQDLRRY